MTLSISCPRSPPSLLSPSRHTTRSGFWPPIITAGSSSASWSSSPAFVFSGRVVELVDTMPEPELTGEIVKICDRSREFRVSTRCSHARQACSITSTYTSKSIRHRRSLLPTRLAGTCVRPSSANCRGSPTSWCTLNRQTIPSDNIALSGSMWRSLRPFRYPSASSRIAAIMSGTMSIMLVECGTDVSSQSEPHQRPVAPAQLCLRTTHAPPRRPVHAGPRPRAA